jgi:hypothetical protein
MNPTNQKIKNREFIGFKFLDNEDEVFSYVSKMTTDHKVWKWWYKITPKPILHIFLSFFGIIFTYIFIRKNCWQLPANFNGNIDTDWLAGNTLLVISPFLYITAPRSILFHQTFNSTLQVTRFLQWHCWGFCSSKIYWQWAIGYRHFGGTVPSSAWINTSQKNSSRTYWSPLN